MALDVGKIVAAIEIQERYEAQLDKFVRQSTAAARVAGDGLGRGGRTAAEALAATATAADRAAASTDRVTGAATKAAEKVAHLGISARQAADNQARLAVLSDQATDRIVRGYTTIDQEHKRYLDKQERMAEATERGAARASGGLGVLGRAIVGAFAVERVIAFTSQVVESGGRIADLSQQTGLGVRTVQAWGYAAEQTGTSLESVARASLELSKNIVGGSTEVDQALSRIGLTAGALKAAGPEEAFLAVAGAIAKIPDPAVQADAAMRLLGDNGAALLPAIKAGFTGAADEAERLGLVMSQDAVQGLDAAGDAWGRFTTRMKTAVGETLGDLGAVIGKLQELWRLIPGGGGGTPQTGGGGWLSSAAKWAVGAPFMVASGALDRANTSAQRFEIGRDFNKVFDRSFWQIAGTRGGLPVAATPTVPGFAKGEREALERQLDDQIRDAIARGRVAEQAAREAQARLGALTGRTELDAALQTAADLARVGAQRITDDAAVKAFATFGDAREIAGRIQPGAVAGLTAAMQSLSTHPAVIASTRAAGQKVWQSMLGPEALRGSIGGAITGTSLSQALSPLWLKQADEWFQLRDIVKPAVADTYALRKGLDDVSMPLAVINDRFATFLTQSRTLGMEIKTSIGGALMGLPQLLTQAFTGGGGITGALKGLGVQVADAIMQPLMKRLQTMGRGVQAAVGLGAAGAGAIGGAFGGSTAALIGSTASGVAGAALATTALGVAAKTSMVAMVGLGAATLGIGLAAVGVYLLARKFFTVSKEVKQAREDVQNFQEELWKTMTPLQVAEAGGRGWAASLITVRDAYVRMGRSGAEAERLVGQMLDTSKPDQARAALAQINDVVGAFRNILGKANEEMGGLLDTALEMGQRLPDSLLESLARLRDMGDLTAENVALLEKLTGAPAVDYTKFKAAADRYGINEDALGQAYQQDKATRTAQQMVDDVDLLIRGGASLGTILHGMREEISALVQDSVAFGTTLPENMQPWIAELARTGQLLDKNGEAITDLSQIRFAESLETSFAKVARSIEKLVELLTGPLQGAFASIPKNVGVNLDVTTTVSDQVEPIDRGANLATDGFAEGTLSGGSWFRDFGAGTPTVLHGQEAVVRRDQVGAFVSAFGGADGGGVAVRERPVVLRLRDNRILAEVVAEEVDRVLARRGVRR